MHYKNGREAKAGDPVIAPGDAPDTCIAGVLHSLIPGCETCNGQVAVPMMGGTTSHYVTIGTCLHAEDAMAAYDTVLAVGRPVVLDPAEQDGWQRRGDMPEGPEEVEG